MNVETIITARSLWFVDVRQLNPRGRNLYRLIVPKLHEWYGLVAPQEFDQEKGVRFQGGEFSPSGQNADLTGIDLTIYHNGVVANGRTSTNDTDMFLDATLRRLSDEGIISYNPDVVQKRQYSSEIIARLSTDFIVPALESVRSALSQFIYDDVYPFAVAGFVFDVDQIMQGRQVPFRIERREGVPFSENLYYSHGPLKTEDHIAVLQLIEDAFAHSEARPKGAAKKGTSSH